MKEEKSLRCDFLPADDTHNVQGAEQDCILTIGQPGLSPIFSTVATAGTGRPGSSRATPWITAIAN
jgi:hypothetical protein